MAFQGKADAVVKACVHKMATGSWVPGDKLPSLRQGAQTWSVDQLTVRRAYQRLAAMGLVRSKPQSGYYLADNRAVGNLTLHAPAIERFYTEFAARIVAESKLSVLGVFRFLAALAEERTARSPEYAFVECTEHQARQIAGRIATRVKLPCAAFALDDLIQNPRRLPDHIRVLVTTGFHAAELADPQVNGSRPVVQVSMHLTRDMGERVAVMGPDVRLLCLDADQGCHVADDIRALSADRSLAITVAAATPDAIDDALRDVLGSPDSPNDGRVAVLSTTLWEAADQQWRDCGRVIPYEYDIDDASAARLAAIVGLPLGIEP